MEFVAAQEVSIVLSSHIVGDLERICDYLVILVSSEVRLAGEVSSILGSHWRISGAANATHRASPPTRR